MLFGVTRAPVRVCAHDGDGFAAIGAERADHVLGGDRAGADQPPTKFCHHSSRSSGPAARQELRSTKVVEQSTASGSKSPLARRPMSSSPAPEPPTRTSTATL